MRRFEYDEAYEDEDVYDDDEPGYHPLDDDDDEPDFDLNAPGLDIDGGPTTDWDLGLTEDRLAGGHRRPRDVLAPGDPGRRDAR